MSTRENIALSLELLSRETLCLHVQLIHRLKGERMENKYKAWVLFSRQQLR